jgi:hypothetical protein
MGRKPLGDAAMTPAQRQRRHRGIHKLRGQATAHKDFYQLAVHTRRLIKLLQAARKKHGLSKPDDGVPFPIKLEMMKVSDELHHLLHALCTGSFSPERQAELDHDRDRSADAENNRRPSRKELERRQKRDAKNAAASRAPTYLFPLDIERMIRWKLLRAIIDLAERSPSNATRIDPMGGSGAPKGWDSPTRPIVNQSFETSAP